MTRTRTLLGATAGVVGAVALVQHRRTPTAPRPRAASGRTLAGAPVRPGHVAVTEVTDPAVGRDAAAAVRRRSRAVLSPGRAQAMVRAASWSETLLGLLAVVITLLLGPRDDFGGEDDPVDGCSAESPSPRPS